MSDDPYDKIKDLPLLERAQLMSERPHMFYFDIGHSWNIVEELVEHVQTVEAERDFFDQERIKVALREEELVEQAAEALRLRGVIDRALDMAGNRWSEWGSRAESVAEILEEV